MNINRVLYIYKFVHHVFVNMKTTGSIEDNYIKIILKSIFHSALLRLARRRAASLRAAGAGTMRITFVFVITVPSCVFQFEGIVHVLQSHNADRKELP